MRLPRVRFTIGRLMVAVLVAAVAWWGLFVAGPRIRNQRFAMQYALANYRKAVVVREVAEYALKEYTEGIYKQEKATHEGQIALAKSDQERAIDRLRWSTEMRKKGLVSVAANLADELTKQQADFDVEQARTQLKVLEEYTKAKQMKSLQIDVERTRADERVKLADYRQEQSKRWWTLLGF